MVTFVPSKEVAKKFPDIDYTSLSLAYSIVADGVKKRKRRSKDYVLYVYFSGKSESFYPFQRGTKVNIFISESIDTKTLFLRHLSHEFRHFMQDKVFKIPLTKANYDSSTSETYFNSPIEIDACGFEVMVHFKIMRLYNRILRFRTSMKDVLDYNPNL